MSSSVVNMDVEDLLVKIQAVIDGTLTANGGDWVAGPTWSPLLYLTPLITLS